MSELMLVGLLKLIARNEELERAIGALQAENERLSEKLKKEKDEENKDGAT